MVSNISGQNVLDQAIQARLSIYPLNFDMGRLAEIVYFCQEGALRIS